MEKFLKITLNDEPTLVSVKDISGISRGAATKINILLNTVSLDGAAAEVLAYEITATTASTDAKTKEQSTKLVALIQAALQTSWTNPVMDITGELPYAVTGILRKQFVWE
tara:strand:- start:55 stop:384 length:330 start_codon:yes stop_codon:yes gene_type:complete